MSTNPMQQRLAERFGQLLEYTEELRPGFTASLGRGAAESGPAISGIVPDAPELLNVIYNAVSGTDSEEVEAELLEFIPGYRLIHIGEYREQMQAMNDILAEKGYNEGGTVFPLLTNFTGDYICCRRSADGTETICDLMRDYGELVVMYDSPEKFLETLCEFYKQEVYFLDEEGFLDCDLIREGEVGAELNPGSKYWSE